MNRTEQMKRLYQKAGLGTPSMNNTKIIPNVEPVKPQRTTQPQTNPQPQPNPQPPTPIKKPGCGGCRRNRP